MDAYTASLANRCLVLSGIENFFTGNVPENFRIPALYFPPPEETPGNWTLNGHETTYTVFAKVFAATREAAMELADAIAQGIMAGRRFIPLLGADGTETGNLFKVDPPDARIVDEGVAQVTLAWKAVRQYREEDADMIAEIEIHKEVRD